MEKTWRWFGKKDKITLPMLRQIGVEGIVTALHDVPNGEVWTEEAIRDLQSYIESYGFFPNGNFCFEENFASANLDYRWIGMRGPREDFVSISKKGGLRIQPFETSIKQVKPISALFYRQQHSHFTAEVTMKFKPKKENELAGLTCYQSEGFNYVFGVTRKGKDYVLLLAKTQKGQTTIVAHTTIDANTSVKLQVEAKGNDYRFNYALGDESYQNLGGTVSGDILSTNVAGGFTGSLIGLYATSNNDILL